VAGTWPAELSGAAGRTRRASARSARSHQPPALTSSSDSVPDATTYTGRARPPSPHARWPSPVRAETQPKEQPPEGAGPATPPWPVPAARRTVRARPGPNLDLQGTSDAAGHPPVFCIVLHRYGYLLPLCGACALGDAGPVTEDTGDLSATPRTRACALAVGVPGARSHQRAGQAAGCRRRLRRRRRMLGPAVRLQSTAGGLSWVGTTGGEKGEQRELVGVAAPGLGVVGDEHLS